MSEDEFLLDANDEDVNKKVDKVINKKLDAESVEDRVAKIQEIKANPPEEGFMELTLHKAKKKDDDEEFLVAKDEDKQVWKDEDDNIVILEPIQQIDLKKLSDAQFADTESHVVPMLIDMAVKVADDIKRAFKPEIRKEPFNWWWVIFFILMIPGIVFLILYFT